MLRNFRYRRSGSWSTGTLELAQLALEDVVHGREGRLVVDVRAARRLGDDLVDRRRGPRSGAVIFSASAASLAPGEASRQRIDAQPSGEITE